MFGGMPAVGGPLGARWRDRGRTARRAIKAAMGAALCVAAIDGGAETAGAVTPNGADLEFILEQIRRSEAHANGGELLGTGPNQIPSPLLPYGLRTVNGKFNNLIPGQEDFGMADRIFPRLVAPLFRQASRATSTARAARRRRARATTRRAASSSTRSRARSPT